MKMLGFLTDEHWHASLPWGVGVPTGVGFAAWLADMPWAAIFTGAGIAITTVGGAVISLIRQWRLTSIEIRERERRLAESPVEKLDPDATRAAELSPPAAATTAKHDA